MDNRYAMSPNFAQIVINPALSPAKQNEGSDMPGLDLPNVDLDWDPPERIKARFTLQMAEMAENARQYWYALGKTTKRQREVIEFWYNTPAARARRPLGPF